MVSQFAAYAADPAQSKGRRFQEAAPTYRTEYQRDRDRIVHSSAFRRLEYKTQVFVNHEGDMFRTRLTHSVEVAQIARSIAREMRLNEDLVEAIALAHDLGHTPFGHAGQDVLNACMAPYGGFEHNLQSLRVVDELEDKYAEFRGLNLTYETREGVLKHCSADDAARLGDLGRRFIERRQPGLEAQLANFADGVAYNNHDVDDGLRSGLVTMEQLCEVELFRVQYEEIKRRYPDLGGRRMVHEIVRRMINRQVVDLVNHSRELLAQHQPQSVEDVRAAPCFLVGFSESMKAQNVELKRFLRKNLYQHYRVQRMTRKAVKVIEDLFAAFMEDVTLLPHEQAEEVARLSVDLGESGRARVVADYIAGMTDRYAILEHSRMFDPSAHT